MDLFCNRSLLPTTGTHHRNQNGKARSLMRRTNRMKNMLNENTVETNGGGAPIHCASGEFGRKGFPLNVLVTFLLACLGLAGFSTARGQTPLPLRFESVLVLEFLNPERSNSKYEYASECTIDHATGRWIFSMDRGATRIFFDGTDVIQTRARSRGGEKRQTDTVATIHCLHEGVPITMDREHLPFWFAYAGKRALKRNEGRPFPVFSGQYIYDLHSHCCILRSTWGQQDASAPSTALFLYNKAALEGTSALLSQEETTTDPVQHEIMRENYRKLASELEGSVAAEFAVSDWAYAYGVALPKTWEYTVRLMRDPALRFSGRITGSITEISPEEFEEGIRYDATQFASITDYRFLSVPGIDQIRYTPARAGSDRILPTNHAVFAPIVTEKVRVSQVRHEDARAQVKPRPLPRAVILSVIGLALVAPLGLWLSGVFQRRTRRNQN
jgi:hypothetical protein